MSNEYLGAERHIDLNRDFAVRALFRSMFRTQFLEVTEWLLLFCCMCPSIVGC